MRKKMFFVSVALLALVCMLAGCGLQEDKKYLQTVDSYAFWTNEAKTAIPQTAVSDMIMSHMTATGDKTKKAIVLGFDGARADSLINVIKSGVLDKDGGDTISGIVPDVKYSAMNSILNDGGKAYISFAGGEKKKESQQATSTAPGWTSILTGVWGDKNGVVDNDYVKNMDYKTFLLKLAEENNLRTAFASSWSVHFTKSYSQEVAYLAENTNIPCLYNRIAEDAPAGTVADNLLHEYMMSAVTEGSADERDVIFGIYEAPDYNGHATNFSNTNHKYTNSIKNTDMLSYEVIEQIKARPSYESEDWLIIMTTDHGGIKLGHGFQNLECRTTWIVSNKDFDAKYYSTNYDGYVLK